MGFLSLLTSLAMQSEARAAIRAADTLPPFLAMNMAKIVASAMEQVVESQKVSEREEYLAFKGMRVEAERQRAESKGAPSNLENKSAFVLARLLEVWSLCGECSIDGRMRAHTFETVDKTIVAWIERTLDDYTPTKDALYLMNNPSPK